MKLEDFQNNAAIRGIIPDALVSVVSVQWSGTEALKLTYKKSSGKLLACRQLYTERLQTHSGYLPLRYSLKLDK